MENAKIYTSDDAREMQKANPVSIGDIVNYESYGQTKQARVARLSRDGSIVFLDNGKWMNRVSVTKA